MAQHANRLSKAFDGLNKNEKSVIDSLLFEGLNDTFFNLVHEKEFVSTISYLFNETIGIFKSFCESQSYTLPYVSIYEQISIWQKTLNKVCDSSMVFSAFVATDSSKSFASLYTRLFINHAESDSENVMKACNLIRALAYFLFKRYFSLSEHIKIEYQPVERRVEGIIGLLKWLVDQPKACATIANQSSLEGLLDCLKDGYQSQKDRDFFDQLLHEIFYDGLYTTRDLDSDKHIAEDDESASQEAVGPAVEPFLSSIQSVESEIEDSEAIESKLQKLCCPESLTSSAFLKPDFLAHCRRAEYALNLPNLNYSLLDEEKRALVDRLLVDLKNPSTSRLALIVSLQMLTSSSLIRLTSFVVKDNLNDEDYINVISLETGMWQRRSIELDNAYVPSLADMQWLMPHSDTLRICLPSSFIKSLKTHIHRQGKYEHVSLKGLPLYEALGLDDPSLSQDINEYLNDLKLRIGAGVRQLSQKMIRYALFAQVTHQCDSSAASLLFASSEFSNPITLYYLSASEEVLQGYYNTALESIGFGTNSVFKPRHIHIGSRMCIDKMRLTERIATKTQILITANRQRTHTIDDIIYHHNTFSLLVTLAFAITAALREQAKCFFDYATINFDKGFYFVSDKYHHGVSPTRLIPLPPLLEDLIAQYRLNLRNVARNLHETAPDLAQLLFSLYCPDRCGPEEPEYMLTGQPLLGLIQDGRWRSISSSDLCQFIGDDFTLPENFTRHFLCSELPASLTKYRQLLMGHVSQGIHPADEFTIDAGWLTADSVKAELEHMLENFGFRRVQAASIRGAFSLERKASVDIFYPPGYVHRQLHYEQVMDFSRKHFLYILNDISDAADMEARLEELPIHLMDKFTGESLEKDVKAMYQSWSNAWLRTQNKAYLRRLIKSGDTNVKDELRLIEKGHHVEWLQCHFLDYLGQLTIKEDVLSWFYLSLCLFQPLLALRLYRKNGQVSFSIEKQQSTFILVSSDVDGVEICAPINWVSSYLLLSAKRAKKSFKIEPNVISSTLVRWREQAEKSAWFPCNELRALKRLCHYIARYGLNTQSRLSYSAFCDNRYSGDYGPEDLGRLLKHSQGHFYDDVETKKQNNELERPIVADKSWLKSVLLDRVTLVSVIPESTLAEELEFVAALLKQLKEFTDTDTEISVERLIKNFWASHIGVTDNNLETIIRHSSKCSEFLKLWLYYGIIVSRRKSSPQSNNLVKAATVFKYLKIISLHLQQRIGGDSFVQFDEETFEILYDKALRYSSYEDKSQVLDRFEDFHNVINIAHGLNSPDWDVLRRSVNRTKGVSTGIARLLPMADYERAKQYFKNHFLVNNKEGDTSQLEYAMHITVMALAYRVGLRQREVRNLLVKHINSDLRVLTVAATRFMSTKSINSPRRIRLDELLNEEEWQCLSNVIDDAKIRGENSASPALFGYGVNTTCLLRLETIVSNVMAVLRRLTGNGKLRFYDLRKSCINYQLMILSPLHLDKRYQSALARWARVKPSQLSCFRGNLLQRLIGGQAASGGILIYGLANQMGHSPYTQRQYYIHILKLLDESMVNNQLSQLVGKTALFGAMKSSLYNVSSGQGFRPEKEVRHHIRASSQFSGAKSIIVPDSNLPIPGGVFSATFYFESTFMALYSELRDYWLQHSSGVEQSRKYATGFNENDTDVSSSIWKALYSHIEETGYRSIYLPSGIGTNDVEYVSERVQTALRFLSVENFRELLCVVSALYQSEQQTLIQIINAYCTCQHDDEVIVTREQQSILDSHLSVFAGLTLSFSETRSPNRRRGRHQTYFKLNVKTSDARRKTYNEKLNFLFALTRAILEGRE